MSWQEPAPGEHEAGQRSWHVVREAYDERIRLPRRRDWRPVAAVAIGVVVLAAAFTPPGMAVLDSIRDVVRGEPNAHSALFSLPSGGRLLTESTDGVWVVEADGSKRLLSGYHDASWSPHGLYLAAASGNELRALEPNGKVHWSIARRGGIRAPRWSFDGFRIAYFAGNALRVVNGDGTGDRLLTRDARPGVSAWEPGAHALAYVNRTGNIAVVNVDGNRPTVHVRTRLAPRRLEWTPDRRLVAVGSHAIGVFARRGPQIRRIDTKWPITAAAVSPDGKQLAFVEARPRESVVVADAREVFKGAGSITSVVWSPDGRWLLLDWKSADQWLFIRLPLRKLRAVSNIRANFGEEPSPAGWCCP